MLNNDETFNVGLTTDLKKEIEETANACGMTSSSFIRFAVKNEIRFQKKKLGAVER